MGNNRVQEYYVDVNTPLYSACVWAMCMHMPSVWVHMWRQHTESRLMSVFLRHPSPYFLRHCLLETQSYSSANPVSQLTPGLPVPASLLMEAGLHTYSFLSELWRSFQ